MTKFTIRHIVGQQVIQTVVAADSYNTDEGLMTFDDENDNTVYMCSVANLLDVQLEEHDEDEDEDSDEDFLAKLGMSEHSRVVHHENSPLKEHATVLPEEHS